MWHEWSSEKSCLYINKLSFTVSSPLLLFYLEILGQQKMKLRHNCNNGEKTHKPRITFSFVGGPSNDHLQQGWRRMALFPLALLIVLHYYFLEILRLCKHISLTDKSAMERLLPIFYKLLLNTVTLTNCSGKWRRRERFPVCFTA